MIIAIDGPAGAGKSTVAERVAKHLGFQLIDTGALYRTVTYKAIQRGISFDDISQLVDLVRSLAFSFRWQRGENHLYCDSKVMGDEIRTEDVSRATSQLAVIPEVREALLSTQRDLGNAASSLIEGRDIGSVVFPHADLKFYLDASSDIRAERRLKQAAERGEVLDFAEVKASIEERDANDKSRTIAPLTCPPDAIVIDSSDMTLEQVVGRIIASVKGMASLRDTLTP